MKTPPDKIWFFQFNNGKTAFITDPDEAERIGQYLDMDESVTVFAKEEGELNEID